MATAMAMTTLAQSQSNNADSIMGGLYTQREEPLP